MNQQLDDAIERVCNASASGAVTEAEPLPLPDPGDPDRKRVLNVLAQRRYRKRRREKYASLEARAKKLEKAPQHIEHEKSTENIPVNPVANQQFNLNMPTTLTAATAKSPADVSLSGSSESSGGICLDQPQYLQALLPEADMALDFQTPDFSPDFNDLLAGFAGHALFPSAGLEPETEADASANDPQSERGFNFTRSPGSSSQTCNDGPGWTGPNIHNYTPLSKDNMMDIPALKIMHIATAIATTLKVQESLWDVNFTWIPDPASFKSLPATFQPTRAQMAIKHHPFFDILPWPGLRERLISVFSLPNELRPRIARDGNALVQLSLDVDDYSEGFRVEGPDGMDAKDWEIGQAFYRRWWWALDRNVIDDANRLRRRRGAARLRLEDVVS